MKRAVVAMLVAGVLASPTLGDRVRLKNGRILEGKVTESEGKVLIELTYGVVSFPAGEVESIERMPTPAEVVKWRLTQIDRSDAGALFEIAEWARDNDLPQKSEELLREVLQLDSDHAAARKLLGYVRADGKWLTVPQALELAASKLAAGKHDLLLQKLLPAIAAAADSPRHSLEVKAVEAHCRLRSKQFDLALAGFERLAEKSPLPDSVRYATIVKILQSHPFGMYVVTEASQIDLSGAGAPPVSNGPASLADPRVLASALRDHAKAAIQEGKARMAEAKTLEETEAEAAQAKYALAGRHFDEADAIVPRIARSWRVEIARRRIAMINRDMNVQAQVFDKLKARLGDVSPAAFEDHVRRMLRAMNHIRADLEVILQLAGPFEDELIIDITDARKQLERVRAIIDILKKERDGMRRSTM